MSVQLATNERSALEKIAEGTRLLREAEEELRQRREEAARLAEQIQNELDLDLFKDFLKQPYVLIHKRGAEWYVAAPRFVNFSAGWIEFSTETYNVFLVNRYTLWLGEVPEAIRRATGLEEPAGDLKVIGDTLQFSPSEQLLARRYKDYISRFESGLGRIKKGREFHLLARLIEDGYLPFVPRPVASSHLREPQVNFSFEGKYAFQEQAYQTFLERGAVTICWLMSAGKSFVAMKALDSLTGPKVIIVPYLTLIDQWRKYFRRYAPRLLDEVEIYTYNSFERVRNRDWACVVYDEAHRLPADSYSRLATLKTLYRMGLSASPYREDNRTNYIFALAGYPIGMDWRTQLRLLGKDFHTVCVHIVASREAKLRKIEELLNRNKKTLIFSDSLELGEQISDRFRIPFISGKTKQRLELATDTQVFAASRVLDLGASLENLEHIIEADFLFGSRSQQLQRTGRLFHSERKGRHDILMTPHEYEHYQKRLHSLIAKGFRVNVYQ